MFAKNVPVRLTEMPIVRQGQSSGSFGAAFLFRGDIWGRIEREGVLIRDENPVGRNLRPQHTAPACSLQRSSSF